MPKIRFNRTLTGGKIKPTEQETLQTTEQSENDCFFVPVENEERIGMLDKEYTIKVETAKKNKTATKEKIRYQYRRFYSRVQLNLKEQRNLKLVCDFYTDKILEKHVLPLLLQKHVVSLRALDWLVTNYAKKTNVAIHRKEQDGSSTMVNIYNSYNEWLRKHKRIFFDPFRRRQRIYFNLFGLWYETTIAQLIFLYWGISKHILKYVENNIEEINNDMNKKMAELRSKKKVQVQMGYKKKRQELSSANKSQCVIYAAQTTTLLN